MKKQELTKTSKTFIMIPESIILNSDMDLKRVAVYTHFWLRQGKDHIVKQSLNNIVADCGFSPDAHSGKINDKFVTLINQLHELGCISCLNNDILCRSNAKDLIIEFNDDWYNRRNEEERFAKIYLDEFQKIMNYDRGFASKSITKSNLLLMFAYLRLNIVIRNTIDGNDKERLKYSPEAYSRFYKDISKDLNINKRTVSQLIQVLENNLDLIYCKQTRTKIKNPDGTQGWRTCPSIFCNTYKRIGGYLIDSGEEYYLREAKNKLALMKEKYIYFKEIEFDEKERDKVWELLG